MSYVAAHGKSYATIEEFEFRMARFAEKDLLVAAHNLVDSGFKVAHNKYSDWTHAEYKRILGYKETTLPTASAVHQAGNATPNAVDWEALGAVTPVKDQGACGSCWSFSSTGALEGKYQIANKDLKSFSEQALVDCVKFSFGCNGGTQSSAFNYWKSHSAYLEAAYPYKAVNQQCGYDVSKADNVFTTGFTSVAASDANALKSALSKGPVSVAIEADTFYFQHYSTGILDNAVKCGTNLDHAVLVVGWGSEDGTEYWRVKNSWNTTWGDKGYIRFAIIEGDGICGVQMDALYPNLA